MPPKAGGVPLDLGGAALETASLCPTGCPTLHSTLHFSKTAHAYHFVDSQASETDHERGSSDPAFSG